MCYSPTTLQVCIGTFITIIYLHTHTYIPIYSLIQTPPTTYPLYPLSPRPTVYPLAILYIHYPLYPLSPTHTYSYTPTPTPLTTHTCTYIPTPTTVSVTTTKSKPRPRPQTQSSTSQNGRGETISGVLQEGRRLEGRQDEGGSFYPPSQRVGDVGSPSK